MFDYRERMEREMKLDELYYSKGSEADVVMMSSLIDTCLDLLNEAMAAGDQEAVTACKERLTHITNRLRELEYYPAT